MAEAQDTGLFDAWITDRIYFQVVPPRTGSTGEFESWITDRIYYRDYVEAELVPPPPVPPGIVLGPGGIPRRIAEWERERRQDLKVILEFWQDYFRNVLKLGEAQARQRTEEIIRLSVQDDVDILDLIDLL